MLHWDCYENDKAFAPREGNHCAICWQIKNNTLAGILVLWVLKLALIKLDINVNFLPFLELIKAMQVLPIYAVSL